MTPAFQELIKNTRLTKKERLIANYVMNHFREACLITSTELAEELNVSYTSVIRFTKDLGFSGYTAFQQYIREQYNSYIDQHSEFIPVVQLARREEHLSQCDVAKTFLEITEKNLQSVIMHNPPEMFENASDAIIASHAKYIVGLRGCAAAASFMSCILRDTLPMVFADLSASINTFDFLSDITKDDCLIAISYPRYSKLTYLAAKMAYSVGATIIVFTDTPTAPLAQYATYLFTLSVDSLAFFNAQTPSLFTAELLCTYICQKIGNKNSEKLKFIDTYTSEMEVY